MCNGCPFNFFSEESEKIQNYGCLPTPMQIVELRIDHDLTWSCHENTNKPCVGAQGYLKKKGFPYEVVNDSLINERNIDYSILTRNQVETYKLLENGKRRN